MKNFWLERKNGGRGFPKDDELSLQQWAGRGECVSLDMYYEWQYIQNEDVICDDLPATDRKYRYGHFKKTYILPESVIGVYEGQIFQDDGEGRLKMKEDGKLLGTLHYESGVITLPKNLTENLIVSYEYDYGKDGTL